MVTNRMTNAMPIYKVCDQWTVFIKIISVCIQMISAKPTYILNVQAQYISVKKLKNSGNLQVGFLSRAYTSTRGTIPSTVNSIIPGIKKLVKGELPMALTGIPIISPLGDSINTPPPPKAPTPKKPNRKIKKFRAFMRICLKSMVKSQRSEVKSFFHFNATRYTCLKPLNFLPLASYPLLLISE